MKKIFSIVFLSVLFWGCAKKIIPVNAKLPSSISGPVVTSNVEMPETVTNNTTPSNIPTTFTTSATSSSKIVVKMGTQTPEVMAQIAGQSTFNAKCGRCHQLKVTTNYTSDRWAAVMAVMSNASHANLSETERVNVLAYVQANSQK